MLPDLEDSDDSVKGPNCSLSEESENSDNTNNRDEVVSASDAEHDENKENTTVKGRKRTRQENLWKRNVNKQKVTEGKERSSRTKITQA